MSSLGYLRRNQGIKNESFISAMLPLKMHDSCGLMIGEPQNHALS